MASHAFEQLAALGGEWGTFTPANGQAVRILGLVDPLRRVDSLGTISFLTKTYDLWIVRSATEGVAAVKAGVDTFALKLQPSDAAETVLRITKILPERDGGFPGDGVGLWHLEAVQ